MTLWDVIYKFKKNQAESLIKKNVENDDLKGRFLDSRVRFFSAENDGGNSPGHSLWELLVDRQRRKINGDIKPAHVWLQTNQSSRDFAGFMFGHVRACASIIFTFWKSAIRTQECSLLNCFQLNMS